MSEEPTAPPKRRSWRLPRQLFSWSLVFTLIGLFVIGLLLPRIFVTIPAGHAGVIFRPLSGGVDLSKILGEGLHIILPYNSVTVYDMRVQRFTSEYEVVARDSLNLQAKITMEYRLCPAGLASLHQDVGPDYVDKFLSPELASQTRNIIAFCVPEAVVANERIDIERVLLTVMRNQFGHASVTGEGRTWTHACHTPGEGTPAQQAAEGSASTVEHSEADGSAGEQQQSDTALESNYDLSGLAFLRTLAAQLPTYAQEILLRTEIISLDRATARLLPYDVNRRELCGVSIARLVRDSQLIELEDLAGQSTNLAPRGVHVGNEGADLISVSNVLIEDVKLPEFIRAAIQNKVSKREGLEAERYSVYVALLETLKREAVGHGVRAFLDAVNEPIPQDYLTLRGVEATEELARSNNAKTVVIGGGGLPVILDVGDKSPSGAAQAASTGSGDGGSASSTGSGAADQSSSADRSNVSPIDRVLEDLRKFGSGGATGDGPSGTGGTDQSSKGPVDQFFNMLLQEFGTGGPQSPPATAAPGDLPSTPAPSGPESIPSPANPPD